MKSILKSPWALILRGITKRCHRVSYELIQIIDIKNTRKNP